MTSISSSGSALSAQSVWNRFIAGADTDKDGSLSAEELAALAPQETVEKAMAQHDANGDGVLSEDELPKGAFSPSVFGQLLNSQEYFDATPQQRREDDQKAIAAMFARADVNGDGVLSDEEWDAERAFNMSRFADTGEFGDVVFVARTTMAAPNGMTKVEQPRADDEPPPPEGLRPEDFLVGHKLDVGVVAVEDLPDEVSEAMSQLLDAATGLPPENEPQLPMLDPETARKDMMARVDAMPMSAAFMTRLLMSLSETVSAGQTA